MTWLRHPRRGRRARRRAKQMARLTADRKIMRRRSAATRTRRITYGEWLPSWVLARAKREWDQRPRDTKTGFTTVGPHWGGIPEDVWNATKLQVEAKSKVDDIVMPYSYWSTDKRGRRKRIPLMAKTRKWLNDNELIKHPLGLTRSHSSSNLSCAKNEDLQTFCDSSKSDSGYHSDAELVNFKRMNLICRSDLHLNNMPSNNYQYKMNEYYENRFERNFHKEDAELWAELEVAEREVRICRAIDWKWW